MTWDPKFRFVGSLSTLLREMIKFLPPPEYLVQGHQWVIAQIEAADQPWLVRYGTKIKCSPNFSTAVCSNFYTIHGTSKPSLLTTDNEATASLYETVRFWNQIVNDLGRNPRAPATLLEFCRKKFITTGTVKPKHLPESDKHRIRKNLRQFGIYPEMAPRKHKLTGQPSLRSEQKLKYSHLAGAKAPLEGVTNLEDELIARTVRCLSPLNIFPTPMTQRHFVHSCTNRPLVQDDIGESFINHMAATLYMYIANAQDGHATWIKFCRWARFPFDPANVSQFTKEANNIEVQISPAMNSEQSPQKPYQIAPADIAKMPLPIQKILSRPTERPECLPIFIVKENSMGRFHFSGFGVSFGGPNRDVSFIIEVQNARGTSIATSPPVTASSLGIGQRGREDFDNNCFRQSDFFKAVDGVPKPSSAIARKINWDFNKQKRTG